MNQSIEDHSTLCRVCLKEGSYNIKENLLQLSDSAITGEFMLGYFSTLKSSYSETIPSNICEPCLSELIQSFLFLNKVKIADQNINLSYLTPLEQETDDTELIAEPQNLDNKSDDFNSIDVIDVIDLDDFGDDVNKSIDKEDEDNTRQDTMPENTERVPSYNPKSKESYVNQRSFETIKGDKANVQEKKKRRTVYKRVLDLFEEFCNEDVNVEGNSFVVGKFTPTINETTDIIGPSVTANTRMFTYTPVVLDYTDSFELNGEDQADIDNDDQSLIYRCQFCPKAFSTSHFLISHLSKAHVCTQCTQSFEKTNELFEHIRNSHKVYKCAICNKEFKCNSNLRQHIKNSHKLSLPPYVSLLAFNRQGEDMWLPDNVQMINQI